MHGFVHADATAETGRGKHANRACEHGGFIAQDVAEEIRGHYNIKLLRICDQLHRAVVHVKMAELDVREILADVSHDPSPELRCFQHVSFVNRGQSAATLAGCLEANLSNPPDF